MAVVGVDADETLWPTNHLYAEAIGEFMRLLEPWTDSADLSRFLAIHQAAAPRYGAGALPLMRSMVEFAAAVAPDAGGEAYTRIGELVERIHLDPVEVFPWAASTLAEIREMGLRVVLITMGVQSEQIGKLERSGLKRFLDGTVVVATKDAPTYRGILDGLRIDPEAFLMVGDSVSQDINPVISLGGCAVLVSADGAPEGHPQGVPVIERVSDVVAMLADAQPQPDPDPDPDPDPEPGPAADATHRSDPEPDADAGAEVVRDNPSAAQDHPEAPEPDAEPDADAGGVPDTPPATQDHPALRDPDPGPAADAAPRNDPAPDPDVETVPDPPATQDHPALRDPDPGPAADAAPRNDPAPDADAETVPDPPATQDHPALRDHQLPEANDSPQPLAGSWLPTDDGMLAVAVTGDVPEVGAVCDVVLPPAPNQPNVWPVEIVEPPQDGAPAVGLVAVDCTAGRPLHPGKWTANPDGDGYVVAVQEALRLNADHHVVVVGETASALMTVRATRTENETTLCWPVDADGNARPVPPRGSTGSGT